jgi:hypothetical protein
MKALKNRIMDYAIKVNTSILVRYPYAIFYYFNETIDMTNTMNNIRIHFVLDILDVLDKFKK